MSDKTAPDYLLQAAKLLGYPDVECIGSQAELDRISRITSALISEHQAGFIEGLNSGHKTFNEVLDKVTGDSK